MGKPGRRMRVLSDDEKNQVEKLAKFLNKEQLADYLGIARQTLHTIMGRDPEVEERFQRGKAAAIAVVAQSLIQNAIDGNVTAQIFFMKFQGGWKETTVVEHTGTVKHEVGADEAFTALARLLGGVIPRPAGDTDPAAVVAGDGAA